MPSRIDSRKLGKPKAKNIKIPAKHKLYQENRKS